MDDKGDDESRRSSVQARSAYKSPPKVDDKEDDESRRSSVVQASVTIKSLPKAGSILSHIKSQGRLKPMKVNSSMAQLPTFKKRNDDD